MKVGLIGKGYQSQSPNVACDRVMNLYPEQVTSGGKTALAYYPTPGKAKFCVLPSGPIRAEFNQDNRTFAVGGPTLYELHQDGSSTVRGFVGSDANPATICGNGYGHQLFVVSAGSGYVLDLTDHVFTAVLEGTATMGGFLDGYFVALDVPNKVLRLSNLMNGLVWDGSMVAARSMAADPWVSMAISHREIWLYGEQTMEVWYNAGLPLCPLTPRPGADSDIGTCAPRSLAATGNTVLWLGGDTEGHGVAYMGAGYQPMPISDKGVEYQWQQYTTISDAIGWSYQDQGHTFYVVSFPTERATWCYDLTTGMWHERGWWNAALQRFDAWRAHSHCFAWGAHLVGDRESGAIYEMAVSIPIDVDEAPIRRIRQTPHLCDEHRMLFHTMLQIDLEVGLATVAPASVTGKLVGATGFVGPTPPIVPKAESPVVTLSWSDDGGHTWTDGRTESVGTRGQYAARLIYRQLGCSRDRVYRLEMSDPVPWRIVDGYLEATAGQK